MANSQDPEGKKHIKQVQMRNHIRTSVNRTKNNNNKKQTNKQKARVLVLETPCWEEPRA